MITRKRIKELFRYDGESLIWKSGRRGQSKAGVVAGCLNPDTKYICIGADNNVYRAHRLIFLYCHGYLPEFIDHIDGNRSNNRIDNLRAATMGQNHRNRKISKNNTSGIKGVSWCKRSEKWTARLCTRGKQEHLGYFDDINEARDKVENYRNIMHGEFANHGTIENKLNKDQSNE